MLTSVRTTRAAEGVAEVAVTAAAGRLRGSGRSGEEPLLLALRDLDGLPALGAVEHDDLALRELLGLELGEYGALIATYAHTAHPSGNVPRET